MGWLKHTFGTSPFIVSCHACYAQALTTRQKEQLLKADDEHILSKAQQWEVWRDDNPQEHDCWPPTFATLAG